MSVIGKQIKKYRIAKGITQEYLGQLMGVTTQAVSKWERGGTPDAELLPKLAQVLSVSIDALFGREEQSFAVSLARRISQMPDEEAYRSAFDICWALELGLTRKPSEVEDYLDKFIDTSDVGVENEDRYAKLVQDDGITTARLSADFRYFFLMTEPKRSFADTIGDTETLCKIFEIFADEKTLRIIWFLYSRLNTPVATSLISKKTGLDVDEIDHRMDLLCQHRLAMRNTVSLADGDVYCYMYRQESSVIPLLCFADEIARAKDLDFLRLFERTKPLFG